MMLKNAFLLCFSLLFAACSSDVTLDNPTLFKGGGGSTPPPVGGGGGNAQSGNGGNSGGEYAWIAGLDNAEFAQQNLCSDGTSNPVYHFMLISSNIGSPVTLQINDITCLSRANLTVQDWSHYTVDHPYGIIPYGQLTQADPYLIFLDIPNREYSDGFEDFEVEVSVFDKDGIYIGDEVIQVPDVWVCLD